MLSRLLLREMIRAILPINGLKLLKLLELIRRNLLLEAILMLILTLNIGMLLPKLIRKKLHISCVLPDKLKHTNGCPNLQKSKGKLVLKWRRRDSSLTKEPINQWEPIHILIHKCGFREEIKQLYSFRDWQEDGLPGNWLQSWEDRNMIRFKKKSNIKKHTEKVRKQGISRKYKEGEIQNLNKIFKYCIKSSKCGELQSCKK